MLARRSVTVLVALGVSAAAALPTRASANDDASACDAWNVEYALSATLSLRDTPMGAGNGDYTVGPGKAVLRFANQDGHLTGPVKMLTYQMTEHFHVESSAVLWKAKIETKAQTSATPDACGVITEGALQGRSLAWKRPLAGYHTEGTLTCEGGLCGHFGAPPSGVSPLRIEAHPATFKPFAFSADWKTFSMPSTFVAKTDMPKQTAYLTLAGREARRTCVHVAACP